MDTLLEVLPVIIYFLLIIFLVVGIILGIKSISAMNKAEKLIDNVNEKMDSITPLFGLLDFATDRISSLTDTIVDFFSGFLGKMFMKSKRKEKDDE